MSYEIVSASRLDSISKTGHPNLVSKTAESRATTSQGPTNLTHLKTSSQNEEEEAPSSKKLPTIPAAWTSISPAPR